MQLFGLSKRPGDDQDRCGPGGAAAQRKIVVWAHIALDFPRKGSIAVHVDGLLLVAARPAPSAGLVVV